MGPEGFSGTHDMQSGSKLTRGSGNLTTRHGAEVQICFGPLMPSVLCGLVKGIENVKCLGSNMFYHEMYAFR